MEYSIFMVPDPVAVKISVDIVPGPLVTDQAPPEGVPVKERLSPSHIVAELVMDGVGTGFTVTVTVSQLVVLHVPSART